MGETEVRTLYHTLITAWNDHDGTAMAAPFADDGVVIGFDGSVSSGKQTISSEMTSIFSEHETGRYAVKVKAVRELGQDAMILRAVAGLVPPGQTAIRPETNSHQTVVAEAHDGAALLVDHGRRVVAVLLQQPLRLRQRGGGRDAERLRHHVRHPPFEELVHGAG